MRRAPLALPWWGGKSPVTKLGKWVHSIVGDQGRFYAEPFAGMLGVLLQRPPAVVEAVGDQNSNLVNWWRCIRDRPDELARYLECTPQRADAELLAAWQLLQSGKGDPVQRAGAFTVLTAQSILAQASPTKPPTPARVYRAHNTAQPRVINRLDIELLAERIRHVQIDQADAVTLLRRIAKAGDQDAVIYIDPPYAGKESGYEHGYDRAALLDAMLAQPGRICLSDLPGAWPELIEEGWKVHQAEFGELSAGWRRNHKPPRAECIYESRPADLGSLFTV